MRNTIKLWIVMVGLLFSSAAVGHAQTRKAGLWEISSTTTWQVTANNPGAFVDPATSGTKTKNVCLTQDMIDKWGALLPQSRGECHIQDKVMRSGGSTAKWICAGKMTGQGTLDTDWPDLEHETGTLHFTGTIQVGNEAKPVEWTTTSTSVFKGTNCGGIKPPTLPATGKR